jgi:prepilin-type N-terminal cleavage/methylation domain-containing protein
MNAYYNKKPGFTLIELLVVITIIAISVSLVHTTLRAVAKSMQPEANTVTPLATTAVHAGYVL